MNDITNTPQHLDNDQVDALMAKLYGGETPVIEGDTSDGEDAQPEGTFISEDETSRQLN